MQSGVQANSTRPSVSAGVRGNARRRPASARPRARRERTEREDGRRKKPTPFLFLNTSTAAPRECGEGELVSRVHTLVGGVVQVYHRLQVLEEEEKVRKVEQEIERENQGRGETHMKMTMDGDGRTQNLEPQCVCG